MHFGIGVAIYRLDQLVDRTIALPEAIEDGALRPRRCSFRPRRYSCGFFTGPPWPGSNSLSPRSISLSSEAM